MTTPFPEILFPLLFSFFVSCCFWNCPRIRGQQYHSTDLPRRYKAKVICFAMHGGVVDQQSDICGDAEPKVKEPPLPLRQPLFVFPLPLLLLLLRKPTSVSLYPLYQPLHDQLHLFFSVFFTRCSHLAVFSYLL